MNKNIAKNRGYFLTCMLVFMTATSLFVIPDMFKGSQLPGFKVPNWWNQFYIISGIVSLVSIIGIWLWKKWAIYVYIGTIVSGILFSFIFVETTSLDSQTLMGYTVGAWLGILIEGLFIWAILRKLNHFR